eukprot:GHVN01009422.1.p1 GENE.GHVN01009422.1~~GHVN01009422.1.p1  ORF type:complete len:102 (-),score=1.81 GHVN01009422.1:284-589(-)
MTPRSLPCLLSLQPVNTFNHFLPFVVVRLHDVSHLYHLTSVRVLFVSYLFVTRSPTVLTNCSQTQAGNLMNVISLRVLSLSILRVLYSFKRDRSVVMYLLH